MQSGDIYEDEMIKLASEMSLMEDFDLDWDPYNLEDARDKIKLMEELVDESLLSDGQFPEPQSNTVDSEPISSAQIREIFALSDNSHSNKTPGRGTPSALGGYNLSGYRDSTDSLDHFNPFFNGVESPTHLSRRPSGLIKSGSNKETVLSIRWKLRWYQKKIVHQIQETHESHNYADGRLAVLIELNDYVSVVLNKLDLIATDTTEDTPLSPHIQPAEHTVRNTDNNTGRTALGGVSGRFPNNHNMNLSAINTSHIGVGSAMARKVGESAFSAVPPQLTTSLSGSAAAANNSNTQGFPSVVSAVYALRRGGNRQETLHAVDNLIQLCNFGGELCLPAVKQMMAAGALQSLLSTLSRASEWPEVEKQISKVVSILVTYEDDWALLQRNAFFILSALYTLQVKTLTQFRTSTKNVTDNEESDQNIHNRSRTASCSSTVGNSLNSSALNTSISNGSGTTGAANATSSVPSNTTTNNPSMTSTTSTGISAIAGPTRETSAPLTPSELEHRLCMDTEVEELLKKQQRDKGEYLRKVQEEAEEEQESLKALLSAAVAKLSLVLASEWGKLSTPLGGAFGSSNTSTIGASMGLGMGMGLNSMGNMSNMGSGGLTAAALGSSKGLTSNSTSNNNNNSNNSSNNPQRRPLSIGRSPSLGLGIGIHHSNNTESAAGSRNARNAKTPGVENDRILQILLNLIETLADDSLNPTRTQLNTVSGTAGSLGIAAITRFFVKNSATSGTSGTSATSGVSMGNSSVTSGSSGLTTEPAWLPTLRMPSTGVTRQNSGSGVGAGKSGEADGFSPKGDDDGLLRQGAIFFSPLMRVDSAAVLCSAALCNLAEVPQCRPGLVSSGALKMIKSWLEIGNDVLAQARVLCFNQLTSPRSHSASYTSPNMTTSSAGDVNNNNNQRSSSPFEEHHQQHIREQCYAFMEAFGPAYELISNAAAALMHLSGGTDGRFMSTTNINSIGRGNASTTHMLHGTGGREYIIGWIDAQILAEGLPAVVVKMLHTGVEAFTSLDSSDPSFATRPTRSVLPAAVGMHLSQTLHQLCSRVQNRQQLSSIDIPFALCILFENIASQTKLITHPDDESVCSEFSHYSNTKSTKSALERPSTNSDRKSLTPDSIYAYIFHFGGIYSNRNTKNSHSTTNSPVNAGAVPLLKRDNSSDFLTLYSANVDNKSQHRKNLTRSASSGARTGNHANSTHNATTTNANTTTNATAGHSRPSLKHRPSTTAFTRLVPDDLMPIMSSITSSCLDTLTYFFADEITKLPYNTGSVKNAPFSSPANTSARANMANIHEYTYKRYFTSIIELMCSERVIESIKMASSFLPRGGGRLATIRVISALTEWSQSLVALYECGIMDVLMLISSESDEITQQRLATHKQEKEHTEGSSFFNIFPTKPAPAERNISGASSISAISSSNTSQHRNRYNNNSNHEVDAEYNEYEYENENGTSELSLEETLSVCYALANLCEANTAYSIRMLQSGLFSIMLKLVRSKHMEIARQALRSISSMVLAVTTDSAERQKYYKTKGTNKNGEFMECLSVLVDCLKSPSSLLQKGATYTLSLLALIDVQLQDAIVEGPLRTVISMLVDPKNDREVRAAAEDVLKNLGFLSGIKDFELCGYDVEILKDWYTMVRSQGPQDAALLLLRDWVYSLFDDSNTRNEYLLHRQSSESITHANEIVHELSKILNINIHSRMVRVNSHSRDSFDNSELNNFLNTTGLVANTTTGSVTPTPAARLPPLSVPTLHRNFTESIMRLLPFCIKSPFHESTSHTTPSRMSAHDSEGYDVSPSAGGQYMNRSMHPNSVSMNNLSSPSHHPATPSSATELYDWLDRAPMGLINIMELFYSSRLNQLLLMDMTSLGVALSTSVYNSAVYNSIHHSNVFNSNNLYTHAAEGYNNNLLNNNSVHSHASDVDFDCEVVPCDYDTVFLLPHPHSISAIMLPARTYQSFSRVGRVIEKMIEYDNSNKMWSLIFRDSEFLGDFHTSLLASLRRCNNICSISFSSSQRVEEDALMGHLVGQIPPNIRFVSFKSTLSRESIQALCMLLRRNNAAFLNENDSNIPKYNNNHRSRNRGGGAGASTLGGKSFENSKTGAAEGQNPVKSKGLLGLALTHLTFDTPEINYIVELLQQQKPRGGSSRHQSFRDTSGGSNFSTHSNNSNGSGNSMKGATSSDNNPTTRTRAPSDTIPMHLAHPSATGAAHSTHSATHTPTTPVSPHSTASNPNTNTAHAVKSPFIPPNLLGGLRFLDLSYNALNDQTCARILTAALNGPLEGLELGGNIINRGIKFCETMELFTYDKMCVYKHRLRYLGLSHNNLMSKTVAVLLDHLTTNNSLTSLDLSENDIDHTVASNECLRKFIKTNTGLRSLDLCHNKLNNDSFREIHLGLLENDSLLLLPMAGNSQVEVSPTVNLIQIRLRENRLLYKSQTKVDDFGYLEGKMEAYQSEEELGQRISIGNSSDQNEMDYYMKQAAREGGRVNPGVLHASASSTNIHSLDTAAEESLILDREEVPIVECEIHTDTEDSIPNATMPPRSRLNSATNDTATTTGDLVAAEASAVSPSTALAKVPGYTLAIAVPVEYGHAAGSNSYNYNSGRARTFSTAMTSTMERKLSRTGNSHTDLPTLAVASPTHRGRPESLSLSASAAPAAAGLQAENVATAGAEGAHTMHSGIAGHGHAKSSEHTLSHSHTHPPHLTHSAHTSTHNSTHNSVHAGHAGTYAVPPIPHHTTSTHPLLEAAEKFSNNTLNVFFSAPLAGFDRNSRPHPLEMLDYTSERELLTQVFREVHRDVSVHFDFATTDALRTALSFGCKALHFSGHGIPHGLCFEDGRAGLQVVKDTQLKDLIGAGGLNLQFVFVSACYSMQVGEAFVKAGVPHVVCVKVDTKIQDAAAIAFTRAFYVALLSGKTVKNSFLIAKEALKSSPYVPDSLLEGAKFVLLPEQDPLTAAVLGAAASEGEAKKVSSSGHDNHINNHDHMNHHNKAIFPNRPVVDWPQGKHCTMGANLIDVQKFIHNTHLPSPPADFEGREVVMHNVIRNILDRRLVSLVGEDGMGKTSVAAAICKYISDRELFADGIVFFRAKGVKDYRSFLSGLQHALLHSGNASMAQRIHQLMSSQIHSNSSVNLVYPEEDVIFTCLENLRLLLVMDTIDELVSDYGESHTDFRLFLGRLFEQCPHVKVLVACTDTLGMHNINVGFGIVEYSVLLGPLTLISTLRLFARLAPSLSTATAKREFISALQPHRQLHVSIHSRDINRTALQILSLFGDGHPAKIVQMACESTKETVEELRHTGVNIISTTSQLIHSGASVGGQSVSNMSFSSSPLNMGSTNANTSVVNTPQMSASTSFNVL